MLLMAKTKLKIFREELSPKVAQEEIARLADIRLTTYRNAEYGKNCSYTTAIHILDAINKIRASREMPPLELNDLGLSIV